MAIDNRQRQKGYPKELEERPLSYPLRGFQIYFPSQTSELPFISNAETPIERLLQVAGMRGVYPTSQPVGNVACIAQGTAATAKVTARVDTSTVVCPGGAVEARDIRIGLSGEDLLETIA